MTIEELFRILNKEIKAEECDIPIRADGVFRVVRKAGVTSIRMTPAMLRVVTAILTDGLSFGEDSDLRVLKDWTLSNCNRIIDRVQEKYRPRNTDEGTYYYGYGNTTSSTLWSIANTANTTTYYSNTGTSATTASTIWLR